jgi:type III secretion protein Q
LFAPAKLTRAQVESGNALCRLAVLAAHEFDLELGYGGAADGDDPFELTFSLNGSDCRFFVPPRLLQRAAQSFFSLARDHQLPEELIAPALEAALAPWMARLEKAVGIELALRGVAVAKPADAAAAPLVFSLPGLAATLAVAPPDGLILPALPAAPATTPLGLVLRLPLVIADVEITTAELEGLANGDVVLLTGLSPQGASQVQLAISPGTAIIADVDGRTMTVARVGRSMSSNDADGNAPADSNAAPAATAAPLVPAAALEEVPLRIVFDLGDLELTLAELKAIAPGQVIDLARAPGNAVRVSVNGRRIGAGEIVEIEGRLGVRITELVGRNERPAS